ncbi:hypothetical protein J5N97_012311 [Dioscorea zingiberensis]|uniref:Lipase-like PAD4 n=1 Tax=Dioscorea zingiberensis TaxID=325984 RepID=A0A9D5CPL6_9LILI|nr:hypothetical protein J5N97_012311 [Dioscorea zingiberensis]
MREDEESMFETSHVLGSLLVSTPIFQNAWKHCILANSTRSGICVQEVDDVVYVAFSAVQAMSSVTGVLDGHFFASVPVGHGLFSPLVREEDDGEPVLVHGCSLHVFMALCSSPQFQMLANEVQNKAVIFTGHSLGGSLASLAALYFLCLSSHSNSPAPASLLCITFGSPLLGNEALSLAIVRERWGHKFCHVVAQHDIMPRLLFCPPNSITPQLVAHMLRSWQLAMQYPHLVKKTIMQFSNEEKEGLFQFVAMHVDRATTETPGSLYRPFGRYVMCSNEGAVCIDNSIVVVRLLYLTFIAGSGDHSIEDEHLFYGDLLVRIIQRLLVKKRFLIHEEAPRSNYSAGIRQALEALGIGFQDMGAVEAQECLRMSKGTWQNPNLKCANLAIKLAKVTPCRAQIEWYKASCDDEMGYYDTFKQRKASKREFKVNINRIKLAQFWNEVINMLQDNLLPSDFDKRSKWINASQFYMLLVEPLDIAEYYKTGMHKRKGHYMTHGRERRYQVFEKWWKTRKKDSVDTKRSKYAGLTQDSCFWAKVEEARQWIEEIKKERDATGLAGLCEKLISFEFYAKELIDRKEVSVDVIAPRSSYTLWDAEWNSLKAELAFQSNHDIGFL